jgi:hypothetical protein
MESLNSQSELPMESLHSQADLGMRTADFFDGSSSDGEEDIAGMMDREASGVEANLINRGRHSQFKRRASQPLTTPTGRRQVPTTLASEDTRRRHPLCREARNTEHEHVVQRLDH